MTHEDVRNLASDLSVIQSAVSLLADLELTRNPPTDPEQLRQANERRTLLTELADAADRVAMRVFARGCQAGPEINPFSRARAAKHVYPDWLSRAETLSGPSPVMAKIPEPKE